jgi:hypothetical protein
MIIIIIIIIYGIVRRTMKGDEEKIDTTEMLYGCNCITQWLVIDECKQIFQNHRRVASHRTTQAKGTTWYNLSMENMK